MSEERPKMKLLETRLEVLSNKVEELYECQTKLLDGLMINQKVMIKLAGRIETLEQQNKPEPREECMYG